MADVGRFRLAVQKEMMIPKEQIFSVKNQFSLCMSNMHKIKTKLIFKLNSDT